MAITINWATLVIFVPQADLSFIGGSVWGMDVDAFRLTLKNIEAAREGMAFLDTHRHNTEVVLSGITFARTFEIINGYTVEFEDGNYSVSASGANHNIADVKVVNQVSLIVNNSAGLIQANIDKVFQSLEDLRGAHSATNNVWFWDPTFGNDTNPGTTKLAAKKTWTAVETLIGSGDSVYILHDPVTIPTLITERILTTKGGFSLRGPGSNKLHFHAGSGDPGDVITIGTIATPAVGVALSGFGVMTDAASGDGIVTHGSANKFENIDIDSIPGDGFLTEDSSDIILENVLIKDAGLAAVHIEHGSFVIVRNCQLQNPTACGVQIRLNGNGGSNDTDIINTVISETPVGIDIGTGSTNTRIRDTNRFIGNVTTRVVDNGTDTHNEFALGGIIRGGKAQGSGTGNNQIQLDVNASAIDGAYDPALVQLTAGPGVGQTRLILEYDGTTKMATIDKDWRVLPTSSTNFIIEPSPGRQHVNEGLAIAASSNTITLNTAASNTDNIYVGQYIFIRSGTGQDQVKVVSAYNGTTRVATIVGTWEIIPDTTSGYVMVPDTGTEKVDEMWKLQGMDVNNDLVVTNISRDAGAEISQTIADVAGTVTVSRDP